MLGARTKQFTSALGRADQDRRIARPPRGSRGVFFANQATPTPRNPSAMMTAATTTMATREAAATARAKHQGRLAEKFMTKIKTAHSVRRSGTL